MKIKWLLLLLISVCGHTNGQEKDSVTNSHHKIRFSHVDFSMNLGLFDPQNVRANVSLAFQISGKSTLALRIKEDFNSLNDRKFGIGPSYKFTFFAKPSSPYFEADLSLLKITDKSVDFVYFYHNGDLVDKYNYWGGQAMLFFGYSQQLGSSHFTLDAKYGIGYLYYEKYVVTGDWYYSHIDAVKFWRKEWDYVEYLSLGISYHFNNQKKPTQP